MNNKVYFLAIILPFLLIFSSSCAKTGDSSAQEEIVFDDGYKAPAEGEVVFDDNLFQDQQNPIEDFNGKPRERTQIAKDGSLIDITYDDFGNKTETRSFYNNPLLKLILLRTAAAAGRQVFVYAQNGEVKKLPENMLDKVLTASPTELANAAGIFEGIKEQPSFTQNNQPPTDTTLKPLPGSQFLIRNQQVEPMPPPETEVPSNEVKNPQSVENKQDSEPSAKSQT